ncbi:MAG: DUF2179 domain-containing protein [Chloroflexi bacterium]|jgi:uncharacterized protein YebE (UPF0316 family)|nr:DUF2179 domain-containing protein [Chloroflexota bacterium]
MTTEILLGGILIFFLRLLDMTMDTLRVLFVVRGQRLIVWVLGFFQSAIFILAVSNVLRGDNHPFTIFCYASGFATGNLLGMFIENKLAVGFKRIAIISRGDSEKITNEIRRYGYGVTTAPARGKDGDVMQIFVNVKRKHVSDIESIVSKIDENAFITADDFMPVNRGGFWRK